MDYNQRPELMADQWPTSSTESSSLNSLSVFCNTSLELSEICTNITDVDDSITSLAKTLSIVVPILFGVIVVVGLFGNALVVIVVACNPLMRSTTNLLIINLAIADLLFIVFCVPFTAWDYAFPFWPFGNVWCKIVQYLIVVCAYASIYTVSHPT